MKLAASLSAQLRALQTGEASAHAGLTTTHNARVLAATTPHQSAGAADPRCDSLAPPVSAPPGLSSGAALHLVNLPLDASGPVNSRGSAGSERATEAGSGRGSETDNVKSSEPEPAPAPSLAASLNISTTASIERCAGSLLF